MSTLTLLSDVELDAVSGGRGSYTSNRVSIDQTAFNIAIDAEKLHQSAENNASVRIST
jgi:hypothetical protein